MFPDFWRRYPCYEGSAGPCVPLFLHERTAPTGERRLVQVDLEVEWNGSLIEPGKYRRYTIGQGVYTLATWTNDRTGLLLFKYGSRGGQILPKGTRFFSGQPDPLDASRFFIKFEMDGRAGTVEGRLDPGGSSISFSAWP
jgi:hypothetical protein